mgnify:CR=1 FL=1
MTLLANSIRVLQRVKVGKEIVPCRDWLQKETCACVRVILKECDYDNMMHTGLLTEPSDCGTVSVGNAGL